MALTRISPGVYRDAKGKTVQSKTGKAPAAQKPKGMTSKPKGPLPSDPNFQGQYQNDPNMTANQNAITYGIEQGDLSAVGAANQFAEQFDPGKYNYSGPGPATGQYEDFRQKAYDQQLADFDRRDSTVRQQEQEDLARWAQATGNGIDSPLYAAKAQQLSQAQNDRLANAQSNATNFAGQEADRNIQGQNTIFDVNRGQYENVRNDPINQFSAYREAVSPSWSQGQEYSDQTRLGNQQGKQALQQINAQKRPSGGGGQRGGMTAPPQTYTPTYMGGSAMGGAQGSSQPSYWSGLANSLAGPVGKGIGNWAGNYISSLL
jgi:hypothetical protein